MEFTTSTARFLANSYVILALEIRKRSQLKRHYEINSKYKLVSLELNFCAGVPCLNLGGVLVVFPSHSGKIQGFYFNRTLLLRLYFYNSSFLQIFGTIELTQP